MARSEDGLHVRPGIEVASGVPLPLGAHARGRGVNFAIFSRHATRIALLLFDSAQDAVPRVTLDLDPVRHRTGDIWHVWVAALPPGQAYAFRADGPYQPDEGHRFNPHRVLLDPYATALAGTALWDFDRARGFDPRSPREDLSYSVEDNAAWAPKCVHPHEVFDWQGQSPLRHPWSDTVIYETHVRGLTIHPSSAVGHPGTFLGVVEKIPYFTELGITTVELMPVQEFNERELARREPQTGAWLRNYWGYSSVAFFAPKEGYASQGPPGAQVREFKIMVRELHRAGIELILDVVFNHTAEGNELGPTLSFRGLDNSVYYLLDEHRRFYKDYSGCGNTLNCNHPVVRDYILDCLRFWMVEMHVDGFRFDLASVLGRDEHGTMLSNPPLLERIAEDPILRDTKLIAEAWDAAGVYQVGTFPGRRWSEWNGRYRDDIRRFWRGDPGVIGALASRICGSADLYQRSGKEPVNSINFVTCHDGFTLNDLVSYRVKHNEANGEANRDGPGESYSDNCGVEGETEDPAVDTLRVRQIKNMLGTLLVSRGVPMLLGGDEWRRTQGGNNNAYCQDNEISWYDWTLAGRHREVFRFVREMLRFRKRHAVLRKEEFYTDRDIQWLAPSGVTPQWDGPGRAVGCRIVDHRDGSGADHALCMLFNAESSSVAFRLPAPPPGHRWALAVDTGRSSPNDVREPGRDGVLDPRESCRLQARSLAILVSVPAS